MSISSMTGYASRLAECDGQRLSVELRSVNARYLEIQFRLPDELRAMEMLVRERLQQRLLRGKIECRMTVHALDGQSGAWSLNDALLASLNDLSRQVGQHCANAVPLSMADILRWPGMMVGRTAGYSWEATGLAVLEDALQELLLGRRSEGQKLVLYLKERLAQMQQQLELLQAHLPAVLVAHQLKLQQRFAEVVASAGEERIAQELAIFAQRVDVDEECSRLLAHSQAVDELLAKAKRWQEQNAQALEARMPRYSRSFWWNTGNTMQVKMEPTRRGFGRALAQCGDDERIVCLGLDISGSITIADFYAGKPERAKRWISMGIAEQSATAAAAGLAREGKLPVLGSYATFSAARNLDQLRVSVCYSNLNVMVGGAHAGVSVGADGATHQALEDLFAMLGLPNMTVVVPCDTIETVKATRHLLLDHVGPKYVRFAREATPIVTNESTPFVFGKANLIRLRGEKPDFVDAFQTRVAEDCANEGEDLTIVACGPMVPEAMRAAWILKQEFDLETRILNVHTLKPIDTEAIARAARETGVVITAEEHQIGALAGLVSRIIAGSPELCGTPIVAGAIGVKDRFGESGAPWDLVKLFELSAEHIAERALKLVSVKKRAVERMVPA